MDRRPPEVLIACVLRADDDATAAWDELVRNFSNLVWSVLRGFRISEADRWDAFQTTWLRALEKLETVREPARFAGWLAQVAKNEVHGTVLRHQARVRPSDLSDDSVASDAEAVHDGVLRAEMIAAVRAGFAELDVDCQHLLRLLIADPPLSYREIEALLDRPIGSIGPTRGRCLDKLRRTAAVRALVRGSETTKEP